MPGTGPSSSRLSDEQAPVVQVGRQDVPAIEHGRDWLGIELNPDFCDLSGGDFTV